MTIKIGSNIASIQAQRRLGDATSSLGKIYERLSSGQRINSASDDAAGLAIAEDLNAKSRIINQGIINLNDGVSLLNIADSAIQNLTDIVVRLEELATQSANGTYGSKQRAALNAEAQSLSKEFSRIINVTEFNKQKLLTGQNPAVTLQAGVGSDAILTANVGGAVGTGTFGNSTTFAMESIQSSGLALGDLNGDGILDMVTAGYSGTGIGGYATVRLGTGSGSFGTATSYITETSRSAALKLSDLNGDGILDLVTAGFDSSSGRATVRLGAGDGTFGTATSYTTESTLSYDVNLGDLNGDGILDLVTAGTGSGGRVTVRLGAGNGTFGAATSFQMQTSNSYSLSLGDINGDGFLDLVTGGDGAGGGRVYLRLGTGTGSFNSSTSVVMQSTASYAVNLSDLNGDGILDLISAGQSGAAGRAHVRLGTGSGSFGAVVSYTTETTQSLGLSLTDINSDGFLDLVTAGQSGGSTATIRIGTGNGSFGTATSYSVGSGYSNTVKFGDLNNDGALDLVTSGIVGAAGQASVLLANTVDGVNSLADFSLETLAGAKQALPVFQNKLEQLARQRGVIGANQRRIEIASNNLISSKENFKAAESRIRDADMAAEAASLIRTQILQQAATAVLAQANTAPQLALTLLR